MQTRHASFLLLRRLRRPLVALILVYAVAVLGFTLVPGQQPDGTPWTMSFLHAFYFVSFLGTTIGLGEIPHPFTDAQRLWATASIYGTVIAWLYAIGALFSVLQDPLLRRVNREGAFERSVRRLREPFVLLCGYDDTGHRVTRELTEDGVRVVVVEVDPARADAVEVDELTLPVPALAADASDPQSLRLAGLNDPWCAGVVALTGRDDINTKVALTARLLAPGVPVLCVAREHGWHPRMAAAGAGHIINPHDSFAERVAMAIRTPSLHVLYEALTTQSGTAHGQAPAMPRGRWVLCGFGPFARALRRQLAALEVNVFVVDRELDDSCHAGNSLRGDPTDPTVLRRAGLEQADALVAGTPADIDNLAIVLAARQIRRQLFIVARQTQRRNTEVFRAAPADLVMTASHVVSAEVLRHLRAPLLSAFLRRARDHDEAWAAALLATLRESVGPDVLESWTMTLDARSTPAVTRAWTRGEAVTLERLLTRVDGSLDRMRAVPLLLQRGQERLLCPPLSTPLQADDQVLFCGRALARARMRAIAATRALAPLRDAADGAAQASVRA